MTSLSKMVLSMTHRPPRLLKALCLSLAVAASVMVSQGHAQSGLRLGGDEPAGPVLDLGAQRPAQTESPSANTAAESQPSSALDPTSSSLAPAGGELQRVTHGAWEVACASNGQCAMAQIGTDAEGTPVLEMVIRKLPEPLAVGDQTAVAVLDVVTPLGVVLTDGLGMTIDGGRTESAPFQICTEQGCLVREPIDSDLVARLKRGANAVIAMVAANQGLVESSLSLSGFTRAYDSIK